MIMDTLRLFCFPLTDNCKLMTEWAVYWQSISTVATVVFGLFATYKIFNELKRLNEQRENEFTQREKEIEDRENSERLKRTEFFLNQHRRLFDNPELYEILCLIDDDNTALVKPEMADKKRKFMTFFEEIALLVRSNQLNKTVAFYMFGYYSSCFIDKPNFSEGIDTSAAHWGLLYEFAKEAKEYLDLHRNGPPSEMTL